jgi:hypothetical protein
MKHKGKFAFGQLVTDGTAIGRILALEIHPNSKRENYLVSWDRELEQGKGHNKLGSPGGHYSWSEIAQASEVAIGVDTIWACEYPITEGET